MRVEHLKRIFELVQRTGDRMVVVDDDFEKPFVIMDIENYEMLLDAFEDADYGGGDMLFDPVEAEKSSTQQKMNDFSLESSIPSVSTQSHLTAQNYSDILEPAADEAPTYVPVPEIELKEEASVPESLKPIPRLGDTAADIGSSSPPEFLPEPAE